MSIVYSLTMRNLKRYYRDKAALFFSLLSVLIVVALYVFFLADMQVQSVKAVVGDIAAIDSFIYAWIVGGLLCIPAVSVPLIILAFKVEDTADGIYDDLAVTPAGRIHIMGGYVCAAWIAGFVMTALTLFLGVVFIAAKGGPWLPALSILEILGVAGLTILTFSGFSFFFILGLKTHSALMVVNTILHTLIGFLAGLYVPIGFLSKGIGTVIKAFPLSHATAVLRRIVMADAMERLFSGAPVEVAAKIRQNYGVDLLLGEHSLTGAEMLIILTGFGLLFYIGSAILLARSKSR
jgi:multidrug/hemolysin transport system permease protein